MKKIALILLFFSGCLLLSAQREITVMDTLISGFANPESVISDGTSYYISNLGKKTEPTSKDGDGFISKMSADGRKLNLKFITGLDAPKGMTVIGKTLYVTDVDKIRGFELESGKEIFNLSFEKEKTNFLNDLCTKDSTHLFVSSTDQHAVFQIDLKNKNYTKLALKDTLFSPNGVFYLPEEKTLYVATMTEKGKIYAVDLKAKKLVAKEAFAKQTGLFDGLWISKNEMIISDWGTDGKGKILFIKKWKETAEQKVEVRAGYTGPADFYFDEKNATYYFPEMIKGKVRITKFR